jgi:ATP-binding cassette subfamily B multidrug efflux pump
VIALVTVPLSMLVTRDHRQAVAEAVRRAVAHTGALNAHIEEAFTGHALVKVFGRQREVEADLRRENDELYEASFGAQFISGLIMPAMMFIGNLNYVADRRRRRAAGGVGAMSLGDVQAFIQYSRQFTQPLTQVARWPTCCSPASRRPSGSSSCSTPRSSRPTRARRARPTARGGSSSSTSRSATSPTSR